MIRVVRVDGREVGEFRRREGDVGGRLLGGKGDAVGAPGEEGGRFGGVRTQRSFFLPNIVERKLGEHAPGFESETSDKGLDLSFAGKSFSFTLSAFVTMFICGVFD